MQFRRNLVLLATCTLMTACAAPQSAPEAAPPAAPAARALFDAMPFAEWRVLGSPPKFAFETVDGRPILVGRGPIPANGFLASPREVGDFRLSVDVKLGSPDNPKGDKMNSGIQIRSHEVQGTVGGLQVEVDPTKRAWSGGVYDERGRAWLAPLDGDEAARAAFRLGEWNHYEIECIGPRIRTRVNGVACAEWFDGIVSGLLAFQVHGGPPCEVAFRAPVIEELGAHAWTALADEPAASSGERVAWSHSIAGGMRGVRMYVEGGGHLEVLAADGTRLGDVSFVAPPADHPLPRRLEVVWLDGAGAVLLDGARICALRLPAPPARVRLLDAACKVTRPELLAASPAIH